MENFSSQITFLNFRDYELGKNFASCILELKEVYNIGWAVVYQVSGKAFLGIVDHSSGHGNLAVKDGVLISLTTNKIEEWHGRIARYLSVSPVKEVSDAGLKSFFFTGPEGYQFEIQQFLLKELDGLFN